MIDKQLHADDQPRQIDQAVRNNARWCDTVCAAHGQAGEYFGEIWCHRGATPRYYPNAITLTQAGADAQHKRIQELVAARRRGACSVKDSYAALDLTRLGFQKLFDAQWIGWGGAPAPSQAGAARWEILRDAGELQSWEAAWSGAEGQAAEPVFLPALLHDPDIAFIAAYEEQRIVAGAIANRSDSVLGISNIFVPAHEAQALRAGCVAGARAAFPGLPLVGYESGQDLADMLALGFRALGPLRVWLREAG